MLNPTTIVTQPQQALSVKLAEAFQFAFTASRDPALSYLALPGMSGWRYRLLINRLISLMDDASYLEVGSWMGSTLCSAIHDNKVRALAIDNWSEFGGPRDAFFKNLAEHRTPHAHVTVVESDFRKANFAFLGAPFEVYLFDGPHGENDQYNGIALALPALAEQFILIVDDWNFPPVPAGTRKALRDLGLTILHTIEIRTTADGAYPEVHNEESEWHNGYFIAVISKPASA